MDGRKYVARAMAAMDKSVNSREVSKLTHELTDAKDRVLVLEQANRVLQERLAALEAARREDEEEDERPRRGRPPGSRNRLRFLPADEPPYRPGDPEPPDPVITE
jgi:hypothetical protein